MTWTSYCISPSVNNGQIFYPRDWNSFYYFFSSFPVINSISFAVIAFSYATMYSVARQTRMDARGVARCPHITGSNSLAAHSGSRGRSIRGAAGHQDSSKKMGRRMTLIVATDAACWLPIIVLGIASLCGMEIPSKVGSFSDTRSFSLFKWYQDIGTKNIGYVRFL